jgi:hypothetical protein
VLWRSVLQCGGLASTDATHCPITLGLTILHIFSRYGHLKVEVIYCTPDDGHIGA